MFYDVGNFGDYLHKVLCSEIQKNPDSAPGVARSYTSEYYLSFSKKHCTKCYTQHKHFKNLQFIWVSGHSEMSEEHSVKKWSSLNEAFKNYESTSAGITRKTHKKGYQYPQTKDINTHMISLRYTIPFPLKLSFLFCVRPCRHFDKFSRLYKSFYKGRVAACTSNGRPPLSL